MADAAITVLGRQVRLQLLAAGDGHPRTPAHARRQPRPRRPIPNWRRWGRPPTTAAARTSRPRSPPTPPGTPLSAAPCSASWPTSTAATTSTSPSAPTSSTASPRPERRGPARRHRSFDSFSQAAEENGQSRIYLGIHWSFDKVAGHPPGRRVADYVFSTSSGTPPRRRRRPRGRSPQGRGRRVPGGGHGSPTATSSWQRRTVDRSIPTLDPAAEYDDRHAGGERPRRSGAGYGLDPPTRRRAVGRGEPRRAACWKWTWFSARETCSRCIDGRPPPKRQAPGGLILPGFAPRRCESQEVRD